MGYYVWELSVWIYIVYIWMMYIFCGYVKLDEYHSLERFTFIQIKRYTGDCSSWYLLPTEDSNIYLLPIEDRKLVIVKSIEKRHLLFTEDSN